MAAVGITSMGPGPQTLGVDWAFPVHHWGPLTCCSIPDGSNRYVCGILNFHCCSRPWSRCFFLSPSLPLAPWLGHYGELWIDFVILVLLLSLSVRLWPEWMTHLVKGIPHVLVTVLLLRGGILTKAAVGVGIGIAPIDAYIWRFREWH